MAEIIEIERKSNVLKRPSLPCLSTFHTINLMAGCPYECRYCYAQSFRSHPGRGKVIFYANTLELLSRELPRKHKKPELVYFSTACEPFAPDERILASLYRIMELLLNHSIFLLISTKSRIPQEFLDLFAGNPGRVHVQVGLTTTDDHIRNLLEPNAAAVKERLATLRALIDHGVRTEVRMDPLMPELTDTDKSFERLCREIACCGVRNATASYLFLRRANHERLAVELGGWSFPEMSKRLYTQRIKEYCGGGTIRIATSTYRRKKYGQLKRIAAEHGIHLTLCRCKNPDLTDECCHPHPPTRQFSPTQETLFPE
jgi:DNA repair photolyase